MEVAVRAVNEDTDTKGRVVGEPIVSRQGQCKKDNYRFPLGAVGRSI